MLACGNEISNQKNRCFLEILTHIHSFLQGWNHPFFEGTTPPFWVPPLSEASLKSYPPLSEIHPNWCIQIVRNTLKWRCYVLYYTKSIENIINITLFIFALNSVFTTDNFFGYILPLMFFIFDVQEEWTRNISNN